MENIDWTQGKIINPVNDETDWDSGSITPPSEQKTAIGDLGRKFKSGLEQLPGIATGLADIAPAIATGTRPFTATADYLGSVTGFTPGKWSKEIKYSDSNAAEAKNVDEAWAGVDAAQKDPTKTKSDVVRQALTDAPKIADAYIRNPMYTAGQIAESVPSMLAGGAASKGFMVAGRAAGVAAGAADAATGAAATTARSAVPGYLERTVGEKLASPIAAGAGEGAVTAGQQMDQYEGSDQQRNALASLAAGVGTGVIGIGAGRVAQKMGLETSGTAMAQIGDSATTAAEISAKRRILGGMISEAVLQELPQSAQEQVWQNYANGKPLMDGVLRSGVEGALAGAAMGAGANIRGEHSSPHQAGQDNQGPEAQVAQDQQPLAPTPTMPVDRAQEVGSGTTPETSSDVQPAEKNQLKPDDQAAQAPSITPVGTEAQAIKSPATEYQAPDAEAVKRENRLAVVGVADLAPNSPLTNAAITAVDSGMHQRALATPASTPNTQQSDQPLLSRAAGSTQSAAGLQQRLDTLQSEITSGIDAQTGAKLDGIQVGIRKAQANQLAAPTQKTTQQEPAYVPQLQNSGQETSPASGAQKTQTAQQDVTPIAPEQELTRAPEIATSPARVLQNRDRSSTASIAQMNEIAGSPDYLRTGQARVMDSGAPVVFGNAPASALMGKSQLISDGLGKRIPVQYSIVEADDVLPSHKADGTAIPEYQNGIDGKLRAVAGNGRAAGISEAYRRQTADQYRKDLIDDAADLGVDPNAVQTMKAPVLVRIMPDEHVTDDIGDRSNISGTATLSAVEQAANDTKRIDLSALSFDDSGIPDRQSIAHFVNAMPVGERGSMMQPDGSPTRQVIDRITSAAFKAAYGNDEVVRLQAQSTDTEVRNIITAMASVAGPMATLENAGDLDIRGAVSEAAQMAVNAKRAGISLTDYLNNADMSFSGEAFVVAQFMAENIRSAKRIADGLRTWVDYVAQQVAIAKQNETQDNFFGATPTANRSDTFKKLGVSSEPSSTTQFKDGGSGTSTVADRAPRQEAQQTPGQNGSTPPTEERPFEEVSQAVTKAPSVTAAPVAPTTTETEAIRPPKWRTNYIQAAAVARQLGIAPKGMKLANLVASINQKDAENTANRTTEAKDKSSVQTPSSLDEKAFEQIRRAELTYNARKRLAAAYNREAYRGRVEDYNVLRSKVEKLASDDSFPDVDLVRGVLENFDHSIENKLHRDALRQADTSSSNGTQKDAATALTAPTPQDIIDQQNRAEAAAKTEKSQQRAADELARHERERKDIAKASEAAADTFELGGDAEQNLSGQSSIFDTQQEPKIEAAPPVVLAANKAAGILDAAKITGKERLEALKDVKNGEVTPEELEAAYPAKDSAVDTGSATKTEATKPADEVAIKTAVKVKANTIFTEDAAAAARARLKSKLGRLNSGIDPEMLMDGITLAGYHIEQGARTFAAYAQAMIGDLGDGVKPYLKSWYMGVKYDPRASAFDGMDSVANVDAFDIESLINEGALKNVPSANERVERDRKESSPESAVGDAVSDELRKSDATIAQNGGRTNRSTGGRQQDSVSVPFGSAPVARERGDQRLHSADQPAELANIIAGADFRESGGDSGITGIPAESIPASEVDAVAEQRTKGLKEAIKLNQANKVPVKLGDIESIRATLPQLLAGQQDDVKLAEDRFAKSDGYGILFTNGTGTGKTFTGLGIVKRFALQGKTNTLIVAPDSKIASDWIDSGQNLGIEISMLRDTKDSGSGVVITTYANLGENDQLAHRSWDLVVADEAHTLMQAADGEPTNYLRHLRAITNHPNGVGTRYAMLNRQDIERVAALEQEIVDATRNIATSENFIHRNASESKSKKLQLELAQLRQKLKLEQSKVVDAVNEAQLTGRTRLVALSATPFAYEKTIDWANGYLFDYNDGQSSDKTEFRGYNSGSNKDRYMMRHFGYSMSTNKLTRPDAKVNTGLMQRQWNASLKKSGALSGRMLDVAPDYDRRFILVESAIGNRIDEALEWLNEQRQSKPFSDLSNIINNQFKFLEKRYLLEAIKATEAIPIVKAHLALGRKVVVFHDYKKGGGFNPFHIKLTEATDGTDGNLRLAFESFKSKFGDLINAPLGSMPSPIEVFRRELPDTLLINGDEKKSDLLARYKAFQDDANGPQVMLVQSAKNKGWSGHDTTGKYQRVLINLGQPTAPTLAIQQEGRIYRTGQASDAIMRYMNTGTNWERWTFATTIASRASTTENLGMGEMARALKDSFIQSFDESDAYPPGHDGEGKGGKARDKAANDALTEFDRAKSYYWSTQKKNNSTKAQEGIDYFATPEPLGLKMAQWLDMRGGENVLEPSAGHGAIARWIADNTKRTAIEPSLALRSRLSMVMNPTEDRIIGSSFEEHHVSNKYDGIVMNPPFGTGGRMAVDHLAKAALHLRDGGRIVALIPTGPAADKAFEKWFHGENEKPVRPLFKSKGQDVFLGDTVYVDDPWPAKNERKLVVGSHNKENNIFFNVGKTIGFNANEIKKIEPTGQRTESVKPADGLQLVANIKLPQVTFERAGTEVSTRVVVIEKSSRDIGQSVRDLSGISDINKLFDQLENLEFAGRSKSAESTAVTAEKSPKTGENQPPKAASNVGDNEVEIGGKTYPIEIYTTNAGKEKRGVWMNSKSEASKYSPRTFTHSSKKGKWFVDEYWLPQKTSTPKFSRALPNVSDPRTGISTALLALGQDASLFQYPRSDSLYLEHIAEDKSVLGKDGKPHMIKVSPIERNADNNAQWMLANTTPKDDPSTGTRSWMLQTPTGKWATLTQTKGQVYVNVSGIGEGNGGSAIYDLAANFALNNGLVFVGDPNGVSPAAMRRRLENMLSSAIKYGTTDHLQPHPDQYLGDASIGVPELDWKKGDTLGNIRSMIDVSLGANAFSNPFATALIHYDPATQSFVDEGGRLDHARLSEMLGFDGRTGGTGQAGNTTIRRNALFQSLLQSVGNRTQFVAQLHSEQNRGGTGVGSALEKTFYSRGTAPGKLGVERVQASVNSLTQHWVNAPKVVVVSSMDDTRVPQAVRDEDAKQRSQGATGSPEGFVHDGVVYLVADQLVSAADVKRVLMHEALGHIGLRGVFGHGLTQVLNQVILGRRAEVSAKAAQYGLDMNDAAQRLDAAEELLAEMAQAQPEIGFVKRAVAAIRTWLRDNVPGFKTLALTDAEIVRSYLLPARGFIERGAAADVGGRAAFSRGTNEAMTNTPTIQSLRDIDGWEDMPAFQDDDESAILFNGGDGPYIKVVEDRLTGLWPGLFASKDIDKAHGPGMGENVTAFRISNDKMLEDFDSLDEDEVRAKLLRLLPKRIASAIQDDEDAFDAVWKSVVEDRHVRVADEFNELFGLDYAEGSWEAQSLRGRLAAALGYDAVAMDDEHGTSWYIRPGIESIPLPTQATNPDIRFSRSKIVGQTTRVYSADVLAAMQNTGMQVEVPTLQERAKALWKDAGKKLTQGIVDQFSPVKDLSQDAYRLLRMSKGASGAFEAMMHGGMLKINDGVYDIDRTQRGGVIEKLFKPMQGEHHDFLRWVAANRAERLLGDGREHLFTQSDVDALKTLADGALKHAYTIKNGARTGQTTTSRSEMYKDSLVTFNEFNRNALDMAEQSGLIDAESRKDWESEFYVPFYRAMQEDGSGVVGGNIKGGVVRQSAFKHLKGGRDKLNADLLDNTLMNWAHLLDAGAKNRAALATLEAAQNMGVAIEANAEIARDIGKATHNRNGVVWAMDKGVQRYFVVDDPYIMTALTSLEYAGMRNPVMNAMGTMKRVLTVGVTASPFFKIRNLIRDSVQAIGLGDMSYNVGKNLKEGWKLTDPKSDAYFSLLASGGTIHFSSMYEGNESRRIQALVESGVDRDTILNDPYHIKNFYHKTIEPLVTAYNEVGNRGEAINRAALYDHLIKKGVSHAEAALQARDLMDFSMQGSFTSIRFLTQVVPFMNARLQGLYKLGKSAKENPQRFAAVLGAVTAVSLFLLAAYGDDDDWKRRDESDRNNFWWFKIGGIAYRIPKPFEIGSIATLTERGFELAFDKEMTNARFRSQVLKLLGDNLSMNPIPQLVKPMLDVYANIDGFSGRPIESMGMENLRPEYRFNEGTSMLARGASTALNSAANMLDKSSLSPVQIDHMLRGYFGWLGSFVIGTSELIARPVTGQPSKATPDYWKMATGSIASSLDGAQSRYVSSMYEQANSIAQDYGTWRAMIKEGKPLEAQEYRAENSESIGKYHRIEAAKKQTATLNQQIKIIERGNASSAEKRERITTLRNQQNLIAKMAMSTE